MILKISIKVDPKSFFVDCTLEVIDCIDDSGELEEEFELETFFYY
jgi:hypothetical protein